MSLLLKNPPVLPKSRRDGGSGSIGKMEDVSDIICSRNHKSGGNPDLSVCLLLVWHCRRQHKREWLAGSSGSVPWNLDLVGRTYCCSFPGRKKEEKKQFSEGEPDFRGSSKPVRSSCFYKGTPYMKR